RSRVCGTGWTGSKSKVSAWFPKARACPRDCASKEGTRREHGESSWNWRGCFKAGRASLEGHVGSLTGAAPDRSPSRVGLGVEEGVAGAAPGHVEPIQQTGPERVGRSIVVYCWRGGEGSGNPDTET